MKQFVLSGIVIGFFIMFSLYYRVTGQSITPIIPSTAPTLSGINIPTSRQEEEDSIPLQNVTLAPTIQNIPNPVAPTNAPAPTSIPRSGYKDGAFVGSAADAFYGNIQVQVTMQNGKITDVQFLQYPNDRSRSMMINQYAMPILKSEAIQSQNANVNIVSGATDSSLAFIQSLQSALNNAKI